MNVEIQPNYIYVKVPYHDREKAKRLGAKWNESRKMWRFPNTLYMMRELVQVFPTLRLNDTFMEYGRKKRENQDRMLQIKAKKDTEGDPRLRPYQRVDVEYLSQLPAAGVFNQQRTGKTPTILCTLNRIGAERVIVVCPASLVYNWKEEVERWTLLQPILSVCGKKKRVNNYQQFLTNSGVLIISYETLRNDLNDLKNTLKILKSELVIIADEAHRLRNRDTQQTKALYELRKFADRAYALTGTPTVRNGTDIFGILQFLYPERFTAYWEFVERYFQVQETMFGKEIIGYNPKRKQELQEIVGLISVQRRRKDPEVMAWLPPKDRQTIWLDMDEKQRKAYKSMLETFAVQLENGEEIDASSVLTQILRLRQIALDPALLDIDAPSVKTKALLEWLDNNPREPVVVMSWFTSYLKRLKPQLEEKGYKVGMIYGEMKPEDKHQNAKQFQDGQLDVLLCNIQSAGVGYTLDRAENVIFMDKMFNPTDNEQAEDRIVPVSEERNHAVNIISMVCKDSVDEMIEEILKEKKNLTDVINKASREAILRLLKNIA